MAQHKPRKHKSLSKRRLDLSTPDKTAGYVVGVDIGGSNLRIAVSDRKGSLLGKWATSTKETTSPQVVISLIRKGIYQLLQQTAVPHSSLRAIVVGAPGVTDRDAGVVFATSYLRGWKNVPLAALLQSDLRLPVVVENDVKLAAIGEHWAGAAQGIPNFVFLAIGTGIAAGIFVNGQLVHGRDWIAGEVGYLIVPGTRETPSKPGEPGPLEGSIGGEGIRQQWLASCPSNGGATAQNLTATGIFYHALAGNPQAMKVLDRSARILAYAVYNISAVLNPSLFVLGGGVGMNGPLIAATERILECYTQPSRPQIVTSALGQDAQLMGAIRLALDKAESQKHLQPAQRLSSKSH
jgi:glucokinase